MHSAQWCSKTTKLQDQDHFFETKTVFLKTIKLLTQNLKKHFLTEKIRPVKPVLPSHAGNRKKPAYYRLSSQVLLHPWNLASSKIRIFRSKKGLKTFLVLRPSKTALVKTKTSKNGLKNGLKTKIDLTGSALLWRFKTQHLPLSSKPLL